MRKKQQKKKKPIQKIPIPTICPKCKERITTPPKIDPLYNAFRKWKCEHCATVWAENFQKGSCKKYGIVQQSRCLKCNFGQVARAKGSNCPFFIRTLNPPMKWILKDWERT